MFRDRTQAVLLISFLFTVFCCVASAQQHPLDQDEPLRLKTDLVTITASVLDRGGHPIKSLRPEDFSIFEDGARQKIAHFAATEEPFSLLLLLDLSGSTLNEIDLMKRAARNFIAELRRDDRVGVIAFSREINRIAPLGQSRSAIDLAIDAIAAPAGSDGYQFNTNTGTSFYDALYVAMHESQLRNSEGRKAIVCMSDAVDSTSSKSYADVAMRLERSEVSVYFLKLDTEQATLEGLLKPGTDPGYLNFSRSQIERYYDNYDPDSPNRNLPRNALTSVMKREINRGLYELAQREVTEMSERTGGRIYKVRSLFDLAGVYKQLADELRTQYSIGYYPSNQARDGRWRSIRVEVDRDQATVRARSGYRAGG
jgi:Ca-activated chloride channel homolog